MSNQHVTEAESPCISSAPKPKSYGQVGYEAMLAMYVASVERDGQAAEWAKEEHNKWENQAPRLREEWEHVAAAISDQAAAPVYKERNALVCALSKIFPSHLMDHPVSDETWDPEWTLIVCIEAPLVGQLTWHVRRDELAMFSHLSFRLNNWDGHSTEEKYRRLASIPYFEVLPSTYREFKITGVEP